MLYCFFAISLDVNAHKEGNRRGRLYRQSYPLYLNPFSPFSFQKTNPAAN